MAERKSTHVAQLKEAGKLAGARWITWLERGEQGWRLCQPGNLKKGGRVVLQSWLERPEPAAWLAGALSSGRVRSRQTGAVATGLGCTRIYAFPNPSGRAVLLVGVDRLEKALQDFFRILALGESPWVSDVDEPEKPLGSVGEPGMNNPPMPPGGQNDFAYPTQRFDLLIELARRFTDRDQHFPENPQIDPETYAWALNIDLIHEAIQRVVGLMDVKEIAQKTAELIAESFHYEFSTVLLSDEDGKALVCFGHGGTYAHLIPPAFRYPSSMGITGRVFHSGESYFSNDVSQEPAYFSTPGWEAGAELCVPLREGDRVFGLIDVEKAKKGSFSAKDVILLEALAGIVSSVMMNAQRYQEMERLYKELRAWIEAHQNTELKLLRSARLAAVGELAAGVAHELNNPLTTIAGFVALVLEETPPDSRQYEDLSLVLREARRAGGVVRQLLDFSRQTDFRRIPVNLDLVAKETLTLVRHLIKTGGVEAKLELCPDAPPVSADPNQIKQVLLNLIHNALQAMPNGGSLVIETTVQERQGENGVVIAVRDTGEGIPIHHLSRIFEPFFTTRPAGVGTGLGLSVSYGIVTSHGGTIDVESKVDQGSCFTVWLPQARSEAHA